MKNKYIDLNNHLFLAIERLNREDISPEELEVEIKRATALTLVSEQVIKAASVSLAAYKMQYDAGVQLPSPAFFDDGKLLK